MKIIADTHTHTIASDHAYSTILENAKYASEIGIKYLAMTDHASSMPDSPHIWHFYNMSAVPSELFGVRILKGAEVNILNDGLDFDNRTLSSLEWAVASIHSPVYKKSSVKENTNAYISAAKNKYIDVIGHSGLADYPYDYEKAVKAFKEYGKLLEINEHSFEARAAGIKNCLELAKLCKKYECRVVLNSDAHFAYSIGHMDRGIQMLNEIDFPENLIVNSSVELFEEYLDEREKRIR